MDHGDFIAVASGGYFFNYLAAALVYVYRKSAIKFRMSSLEMISSYAVENVCPRLPSVSCRFWHISPVFALGMTAIQDLQWQGL